MIRPLVAKELRDQRPFLWLALFFIAADLLSVLWTEPLGFSPYAKTFMERFKAAGDLSVMTFVLAFALGTGLLVREQDDRTLEFLDALPVSRGGLFGVKLLVAIGTVLVYPLGMTVWTLVQHGLSRTSLDPGLHLDLVAMGSVLRVAQVVVVLALALALAPLRRLCWTALAVLMLGHSILEDRLPWLAALNPLRLTVPQFDGAHWRWPLEALGLQLSIAAVLLAVAMVQFLGVGQRFVGAVLGWIQGSWVGTLVTLATVGLFIAFMARLAADDPSEPTAEEGVPRVTFPTNVTAQAATRHYAFTYPAGLRKRAEPLLDGADAAYEQVRTFLGVEAGAPIRADLGGSARSTAGTAYWDTLRLDLGGLMRPERSLAVLGHETTHVLAQRIVGADAVPRLGDMKLLNEGLATYVEVRFFSPDEAEEYQLIAAAARARREVKVDELLDPDRLAAERDEDWVYPLGRAFVEALVQRHGDGAPARVLAAVGRKDAPEGLEGALSWQDAFQTAGIDLSQVFDDFFASLDEQVRLRRDFLDALPRPRGVLVREGGKVGIRAIVDGQLPEGWSVVCRFRPDETSESHEFEGPFRGEGPHWRAPSQVSEGRVWYQLGIRGPRSWVLYEPWTMVRAR